jgi:hypothetical protein
LPYLSLSDLTPPIQIVDSTTRSSYIDVTTQTSSADTDGQSIIVTIPSALLSHFSPFFPQSLTISAHEQSQGIISDIIPSRLESRNVSAHICLVCELAADNSGWMPYV